MYIVVMCYKIWRKYIKYKRKKWKVEIKRLMLPSHTPAYTVPVPVLFPRLHAYA